MKRAFPLLLLILAATCRAEETNLVVRAQLVGESFGKVDTNIVVTAEKQRIFHFHSDFEGGGTWYDAHISLEGRTVTILESDSISAPCKGGRKVETKENLYRLSIDKIADEPIPLKFGNQVTLKEVDRTTQKSPLQRPELRPYYLANTHGYWKTNLGKPVSVKGVAVQGMLGAGLNSEHGPVWIDGLTTWPTDVKWKIVTVTGTVISRHDGPVLSKEQLELPDEQRPPGTAPIGKAHPEGSKELHEARRRYLLKNIQYTIVNQGVDEERASPDTQPAEAADIVRIDAEGKITLNGAAVEIGKLSEKLTRPSAIISADKSVLHKTIVAVLNEATEAGITNVSFATEVR